MVQSKSTERNWTFIFIDTSKAIWLKKLNSQVRIRMELQNIVLIGWLFLLLFCFSQIYPMNIQGLSMFSRLCIFFYIQRLAMQSFCEKNCVLDVRCLAKNWVLIGKQDGIQICPSRTYRNLEPCLQTFGTSVKNGSRSWVFRNSPINHEVAKPPFAKQAIGSQTSTISLQARL